MRIKTPNTSLLPTPLTPLASAHGVKCSLATLGAAEFNRYVQKESKGVDGCRKEDTKRPY